MTKRGECAASELHTVSEHDVAVVTSDPGVRITPARDGSPVTVHVREPSYITLQRDGTIVIRPASSTRRDAPTR